MEARKLAPHNSFFDGTRTKFNEILERVQSESWHGKTHSVAEEALGVEGRELMLSMLEDWCAERIERTRVRRRERHLTTSLGVVSLNRLGYGHPGLESLFVLDTELNLPQERYSLGLRRRVATEAAKVSFEEVGQAVKSATGVKIPKRQLEELAERAAVDFSAFYKQRVPAANGDTGDLLVISTDGKGVSMRRGDLREATRKAAEKRRPKLTKRLSKGEDRDQADGSGRHRVHRGALHSDTRGYRWNPGPLGRATCALEAASPREQARVGQRHRGGVRCDR